MKTSAFAVAVLLASALCVTATAVAQSDPPVNPTDAALHFRSLDKNHDGLIARSEIRQSDEMLANFHQYDWNRDHRISMEEYVRTLRRAAADATCHDGSNNLKMSCVVAGTR